MPSMSGTGAWWTPQHVSVGTWHENSSMCLQAPHAKHMLIPALRCMCDYAAGARDIGGVLRACGACVCGGARHPAGAHDSCCDGRGSFRPQRDHSHKVCRCVLERSHCTLPCPTVLRLMVSTAQLWSFMDMPASCIFARGTHLEIGHVLGPAVVYCDNSKSRRPAVYHLRAITAWLL